MPAPIMLRLFPTGRLARNTILAIGWQGLRVGLQATWVVMLARTIGPGNYGTFAGIAGLATALGALTGLGFGVLMLQDASRDLTRFSVAWKRALWMVLISGLSLWAIYQIVAPHVFHIQEDIWFYAAIGVPELICFPVTIVASYAFQLHERMSWAGAIFTLISFGNLVAFCVFLAATTSHTLPYYLPFHALASVVVAASAVVLTRRLLAPAAVKFSLDRRDMREGLGFSLMRLADTGMTSLDKTLVLTLAGSEVAGIYSAAYRFVAVFALPATSLGMAALPRLFRNYSNGISKHSSLVRTLVLATLGYGIVAAILVWALSGVVPWVLGPAFTSTAQAARWMSLFPMLYGMYALGCNVLVTSDQRNLRLFGQAAGIAILLAAAFLWVPRYGLAGAAGMLLFMQSATALLLWLLVWRGRRLKTSRNDVGE